MGRLTGERSNFNMVCLYSFLWLDSPSLLITMPLSSPYRERVFQMRVLPTALRNKMEGQNALLEFADFHVSSAQNNPKLKCHILGGILHHSSEAFLPVFTLVSQTHSQDIPSFSACIPLYIELRYLS